VVVEAVARVDAAGLHEPCTDALVVRRGTARDGEQGQ